MQSRWKYVERHFALSEQCSNGQCTEFCRFLKSCKYWKFSRWPNLRFGSACAFFLRRVSEGSTSRYVVGPNLRKVSRSKGRNHLFLSHVFREIDTHWYIFRVATWVHCSMNFVERNKYIWSHWSSSVVRKNIPGTFLRCFFGCWCSLFLS